MSNYFNKELSWVEFNYRVLEEALNPETPLLEKVKFLSIFSNNLDEFFMVRVSGLFSQIRSGYELKDYSGLTAREIISKISKRVKELIEIQYDCFNNKIIPELEKIGFYFYTANNLPSKFIEHLRRFFLKKIFYILTPMAVDQSHPFPFLKSKTLNIIVKLRDPKKPEENLFAIIPYPSEERFIPLFEDQEQTTQYIYIGELIKLFIGYFFKGYNILETATVRITRDAELSIDEEGAEDLLAEIEDKLKAREKGLPIRIEIEKNASSELKNFVLENTKILPEMFFEINGIIDLSSFLKIAFIKGYEEYKDPYLPPILPCEFCNSEKSIFEIISQKDRMLSLPYESFDPVVNFIEQASKDPKVLAIKMTLYRTSGDSPIIKALKNAAENNKQVTVLVELKARFDEAQNITWAKELEKAGCHVIYGLVGLKTHCKITLVVRDEEDGLKRYVHLSTGNYNENTAKIYTDIGIFTSRVSIGRDVASIFNLLTGYSEPPRWKKLVCAPLDLRDFLLEKIKIEKENALNGGKGKIIAKMNALVDIKIIDALYEASNAGVDIFLIVRGMCCLKPGIKGLSENIKVISIIDRFLEHSRIFYFYNAGDEDIYLSSADWMQRNFDRRVEVLFPIEDEDIKKEIMTMLKIIQNDNLKARELLPDGRYIFKKPEKNEKPIRSQIALYEYFKEKNINKEKEIRSKFIPKMKPEEKI